MAMRKFVPPAIGLISLFGAALLQGAEQDQNLVKQGEYVARLGDCMACHTAPGGQPFAGGYPLSTPMGTLYSTNITPDKTTGIGDYSYEDFEKAVRHGIAKPGYSLYPAMPYPSYARLTDDDIKALYAYMMQGVKPVNQSNRSSNIPWPLSMRWPLSVWRMTFAPKVEPFKPAPGQDPITARGAYIVEGLGHCGTCHTPRGVAFQEEGYTAQDAHYLAGDGLTVDGFVAPNLRADTWDGLGSYSQPQLEQLLKTARNDSTALFGPMATVAEGSLQYFTDDDIHAVATYLKSLSKAKATVDKAYTPDPRTAQALLQGDTRQTGAKVFVEHCAGCHRTDGNGYSGLFPALAGNPVVHAEKPDSLISLVLKGSSAPSVQAFPSKVSMPGFAAGLTDTEIAEVVSFIRNAWGNQGSNVNATQVAELRKATAATPSN